MAMSVTVLCPNGRRTNIKVNPNTSILQIIEGACQKEKFDPDEYDLKHLHRTLDPSNTVRFANVPNKSHLELVKRSVPRKVSSVTVNIVTETGLRLIHEFPANTLLWDILSHHEKQGIQGLLSVPFSQEGASAKGDDIMEPVIVYTMRRISGDQLKTTTLKSLGLTTEKCVLRHSMQKSSTSGQAHVSVPLSRPKTSKEDRENYSHSPQAVVASVQQPQIVKDAVSKDNVKRDFDAEEERVGNRREENIIQNEVGDMETEEVPQHIPTYPESVAQRPDVISSTTLNTIPDVLQDRSSVLEPDIVSDKGSLPTSLPIDILGGVVNDNVTSTSSGDRHLREVDQDEECQNSTVRMGEIVKKLGSRGAILFHMDDAPPTRFSHEDESFFQLTIDEVKSMHKEYQKTLNELQDAPLKTKQMREMEENVRVLSALNQYPVTNLRIYFPDNHVIQGCFKPTEKVADVIDFLRPYIADSTQSFSLCIRHPVRLLSPELTLVEADCIPNARLYFTSDVSSPYLNEETLAKKSSFTSAASALTQKRQRREKSSYTCDDNASSGSSVLASSSDAISSSLEAPSSTSQRKFNSSATGAIQKVPKWFRTGK
ncbi:Tether containing UBX domain for GLUT4 [Halocaridina rubra]|uniref:Tether containing UBX domain for GLUT4 n=1 Tax=Halocaridina rubra TaxID=373956 RepID=A0AAN8WKW2_HALRR